MSMSGLPQGRDAVGETIASFPTYEGAQKAVSALIAGDVPAREIAIVGSGLRSVERVTGRLGYATAARSGAINGLLLGLFFSAIFVLGNSAVQVSAFVGVLFLGVALGMLLSIVTYAMVRRRKDFASVMQITADHYEVTVQSSSIHRARQVLSNGSIPSPAPRPRHPSEAPNVDLPQPADSPEPPRYGERISTATPAALVPPTPPVPPVPPGPPTPPVPPHEPAPSDQDARLPDERHD
jgi:hypothetical protein